ncbi:glucose-6-phosphate 1-dehydrogenase [Synechococcus sp. PCC 7335]|uniref:glucose-6-phosphate dehydrogenase n=1 Tax=Synechococcus sp. (strain ATCC 29403 / PCC 7335) TaxID=91464 RepID=UPI00017EE0CF|nr:glucose-6-phosphate dehydrogenase [Synechococcus sp. PCC 7335]EDX87420.1 glucose-6-phosphate 1-dehydrogenase [Synechococcus sp. PCC 7335]
MASVISADPASNIASDPSLDTPANGSVTSAADSNRELQGHIRAVGPCIIVIFGATGDLTKRKLIPALYNLVEQNLLPAQFAIVGIGRTEAPLETFKGKILDALREFATRDIDETLLDWLGDRLHYLAGNFKSPETYQELGELLAHIDQTQGTSGNYLHYLATAPSFFEEITRRLGEANLAQETELDSSDSKEGKNSEPKAKEQWRRVIFEKPFGRDLASAQKLNRDIGLVLKEKQIYRIDHYLGKETVQNILIFRFGNGLFEPVWNHRYIDHVQITVAEQVGVEARGGYYDESGALRDMIQNHLFQLLAMVAMEPPVSFAADAVRDEKSKVLRAIEPLSAEDVLRNVVRGQYGAGQGKVDADQREQQVAYRSEPKVAADSQTETFVAMKLSIDNWRWASVPFYLRTGKHLPERVSEVAIQFKQVPSLLFRETSMDELVPNFLVIRIQPNEGISLQFGAKVPGPKVQMGSVKMSFCYADYFNASPTTGYETLLYDCMTGDATLFQRSDNVELGWQVVTPILDVWQAVPARDFPNYPAGSWGPKAADDLLAQDGRSWRI